MTASHRWVLFSATLLGIGLIASTVDVALAQDKLDRTVLPIQAPKYKAITEVDARKAKAPPTLRNSQQDNPHTDDIRVR